MTNEELTFEIVPDGRYLVRCVGERASYGQFILAIFEITRGEHKGKKLPLKIESAKAKDISRSYTGMWLDRLAFEEDKKAYALQYAQLNSDGEFIVNVRAGYVRSVPEPDCDTVERLKRTLDSRAARTFKSLNHQSLNHQ
ncbi:MAG: hypothetical protein ABSG52_07325 [Terriglobales bacterium]|jgi:hypothetical protein